MKNDGYKINKVKNKAKTRTNVYIATTIYVKGRNNKTKNLKNIGIEEELIKDHPNIQEYYDEQIKEFIKEHGKPIEEIVLKLKSNKDVAPKERCLKDFGDILIKRIFDEIGLDETCKLIQKKYKFEYPLYNALLFHVASRIIRPDSKIAMFEDSKSKSIIYYNLGKNDIYRSMDVLYENKIEIFKTCFNNTPKNIKRENKIMLYDMTDTYFEINYEDNLRKRGKGKRNEKEPLIKLGLVTDETGYPIDFVVVAGSDNEQPTLIPLETEILENFKPDQIIMVTDAGLCSKNNKAFNDTTKTRYVTVNPVRMMGRDDLNKYIFDKCCPRETSDPEYDTPEKIFKKYYENLAKIESFDEISDEVKALLNENNHLKDIILTRRYNAASKVKPKKYRQNTSDKYIYEAYFVSFNLRYAIREKEKRNLKIEKAKKLVGITKDPYKAKSSEDFRYYIKQRPITANGEPVEYNNALNFELIKEQEKLDGYYCVSSNYGFEKKLNHIQPEKVKEIEKEENLIVRQIMKNRWVIEDCFRLLKQDFEFHPVNHSLEERIKAHFMTCVMSLLCFKYIRNILIESKEQIFKNYTNNDTLKLIREMKILHIVNENLYMPCTVNEAILKACEVFNVPILKEGLSSGQIRKIINLKK